MLEYEGTNRQEEVPTSKQKEKEHTDIDANHTTVSYLPLNFISQKKNYHSNLESREFSVS